MSEDPSIRPDASDQGADPGLSWQEQEFLNALKRVANARSQLVSLEEEEAKSRHIDEADVAALDKIRAELAKSREKKHSRFGGGSARSKVHELEASEIAVLERMGFHRYEDFEEWRHAPRSADSVDPALLSFARRELRDAEAAWLEIQALEMPAREPSVYEEPDDVVVAEDDPVDQTEPYRHPEAS